MGLNEHEQRLFEQIERSLAKDKGFASRLSRAEAELVGKKRRAKAATDYSTSEGSTGPIQSPAEQPFFTRGRVLGAVGSLAVLALVVGAGVVIKNDITADTQAQAAVIAEVKTEILQDPDLLERMSLCAEELNDMAVWVAERDASGEPTDDNPPASAYVAGGLLAAEAGVSCELQPGRSGAYTRWINGMAVTVYATQMEYSPTPTAIPS
jgi:hypothetical protein